MAKKSVPEVEIGFDKIVESDTEEFRNFDDEFDKIDEYDEFPPEDDDTFDEEVEPKLEADIIKKEGLSEFWDYADNAKHWEDKGYEITKEGEEGTEHEFECFYVKKEDNTPK